MSGHPVIKNYTVLDGQQEEHSFLFQQLIEACLQRSQGDPTSPALKI